MFIIGYSEEPPRRPLIERLQAILLTDDE